MNLHITHVVRLRNCSSVNQSAATSPDLIFHTVELPITLSILSAENLYPIRREIEKRLE